MLRGLAFVVTGLFVLVGCRLDVDVALDVNPDGTGELTVTAVADADVVQQAPGLAADLRFDDAEGAGWVIDGPTTTDDGGLSVSLTHGVTSPADAVNLLDSLGPPFNDMLLERRTVDDETTVSLAGELTLRGFEDFADAELLASAGEMPFADELAEAGADPGDSMSVTFRAMLPGEVEQTSADRRGEELVWEVPLDGSSVEINTTSVQRPAEGGWWAGPLSVLALVALVAWLAAAVAFVAYVIRARRRPHAPTSA